MGERLDMVIFGATGFTGLHCIPYVHRFAKLEGKNLTWGVAGRSENKLKNTLAEMGEKIGTNFDAIPIIIADVNDNESLLNMAKGAKVILNCCGPFRFYAPQVVQACTEAGTHYVDVSGEPEFIEKMHLEYHKTAEEKGIYAISACGLDSLPADLGVIHMQQNFPGTLNSLETYLQLWTEGNFKGSVINYGTWETIVHSIGNRNSLKDIRSALYKNIPKPPSYSPKLKLKMYPHKSPNAKGWALPFLGADPSVIRRSQSYLYEHDNKRPVQVATYFLLPSTLALMSFIFGAIFVAILANFKFGRKLLLDYPEFFTAGFFSKKSPPEETIENTWFSIDFYGEGWKEKLADKDDQYTTPVDLKIKGKVKGPNPGYGSTCLCLVLSAFMILTEKEKMANNGKGGVYAPGAAFAKTSIIKKLNENGLTFEIIKDEN